ncbi:MAG: D-alanyl-D-alanine carboxypeptidase/D-alanyl-D-alanine-endopeptidase [Parabacteroides sp.]|nr:D-alanyl-D-alanine carboxypeptidase/D-alanyl-D-alanine-endopeptidase [Parabacteroides sp.]
MIQNKILSFCFLIFFQWMFLNAQNLTSIEQLLQSSYMRGASFSLIIKDLQTGENVYAYDIDRQLSPASVLKIVATSTALDILGEDYRFPTSLQYDGSIKDGILDGNLYIKGSGDPSLGSSHFAPNEKLFLNNWITALQKKGITQINGSIISDESIFDTEGASVKWLREDMGNYYAPGCYGLSVFDNLYKLSFRTGAVGTSPTILGTFPDVSFIQFKNYLKTVLATSDSAYIIGAPLESVRYLYGTLPANREQYVIKGDIPDPALFLAQYLTSQLQKKGIQVKGLPSCYRLEMEHNRWTNRERQTIITTYSPPLREIVRICNHVSHNLYADALLKTVGLRYKPNKNEVISSFGRGIAFIKSYWKEKGLDVFSLKMNDGSGLAPTNKISAAFMGDLLVYMANQSKASDAFISSLPEAGVEGSVRTFLKETPLQGRAFLKSGGITGVRCYAGYIRKEQKNYAVAVLSNNYSCSMRQMTKDLEKLLVQLLQ